MPSVSKAQHNFMEAVKAGQIQVKGLSPAKAAEWTHADKGRVKNLPKRTKKK